MASAARCLLALVLAPLAAPAAVWARPDPGPSAGPDEICAFRRGTVQALFSAANDVALAGRALSDGDPAGAGGLLAAAASGLAGERLRVAREGRPYLGRAERRLLRRALGGARRPARKALRLALRRGGAGTEIPFAEAEYRIGALLAEQSAAQAEAACAPAELRVARLLVGASEIRSVPGGARIAAGEGVELLGTLAVAGARADGLTLVAESGDVVLEGTIDASGRAPLAAAPRAATAAAGPLATRAPARAARAGAPSGLAAASCGDAADVEISSLAGNLWIGPRHYAAAGDGADCPRALVESLLGLDPEASEEGRIVYHGRAGGRGGGVRLHAPLGAVVFASRSPADPAPFAPGDGGAGEDLELTDALLLALPPFPELGFQAGSGGPSGTLRAGDAATQVGLEDLPRLHRSGAGGAGGELVWDQVPGTSMLLSPLRALFVSGGDGGEGVRAGGPGGDVLYDGDRVVYAREGGTVARAPDVQGTGGRGGDRAFAVVGPLDPFEGGAGGDADVVGHRGASGDESRPSGDAGGGAIVHGGTGGSDLGRCPVCTGGAGGTAAATSGRGGDGCGLANGAGGDGGRAGDLIVRGGQGGTGGGRGGDGGSALRVEIGAPGRGADGAPPGVCGSEGEVLFALGGGGGEGDVPGVTGHAELEQINVCVEGELVRQRCGAAPPPPPPPPADCSHPWSFTLAYESTTPPVYADQWGVTYLESCPGDVCQGRSTGGGSRTRPNPVPGEPPLVESFSVDADSLYVPPPGIGAFAAHCGPDGALHAHGTGVDDVGGTIVRHSCDGPFCPCFSLGYTRCCVPYPGANRQPCP